MTVSVTSFRDCLPAPGVTPALVRIGDDWPFTVQIRDTVGNAIDLTGSTVSAALFISVQPNPVQLTGVNGSVTVTDAVNGFVDVLALGEPDGVTSSVPPQSDKALTFPTCISVSRIDTAGHKHTFDPIALLPLTARDYAKVAVTPGTITLLSERQGPAGASPDLSVYYTKSQVDALIGAIDDPFLDALIFG